MDNIIMQAITLGVMVGAFVCGKYVFPNMPKNVADKLNDLAPWAGKFVVWAREFMKASRVQEKMYAVVKELYKIAEEKGIKVTEIQLKAIAQAAYLNGVPFLIIRAISDKADDSAHEDYPAFEAKAITHCVNLTTAILRTIG